MLFPQEKPTATGASPTPPAQGPAPQPPQPIIVNTGSGVKFAILFVLVIGLAGACGYLFYQLNQVRSELADTRDSLGAEIAKMNEVSSVTTQTNRRTIDLLKKDLDKARAQAAQLSGKAAADATAHADQIAARLQKLQEEQGKQIASVSGDLSAVKTETSAKFGEVSTEVGGVKTDVAKTRSELEKTIADLKSTRGDLGVQSGLIATNGKELAALKALGERNYTDFKIGKSKTPQKVGDLQVQLKSADPKHNRYTIEVIADDKKVEKKDRSINEPVQFLLSRASQPYELVVNDIKKDLISGYLAAPKVQQPRGQ